MSMEIDGSPKSSSQSRVVDARDVPSEDCIAVLIADREYRLADVVTRPEKKIRCRWPPPYSQGVEFIRYGECRRLV